MTAALTDNLQLVCPRCGHVDDPTDLAVYRGCRRCAEESVAVNLVARLPDGDVAIALRSALSDGSRDGIWRWAAALPVRAVDGVRLGEGDTPLLDVPQLAEVAGIRRLTVKNETANPTWSHKDRLASMTVAAARALGADTVTAASTGNHGAALAAYAARAGLRCVIYTLDSVPSTMKILMQAYGADVVAVKTSEERYVLMDRAVNENGWFPGSNGVTPPVGSHPLGVAGYRSLAYEIFEQCHLDMPDVIIVPVAYGDCIAGLDQGLTDLRSAGLLDDLPVLLGAEVFGALGSYVGTDEVGPVRSWTTAAFSIATPYATWQAGAAVKERRGLAVQVTEEEILSSQYDFARRVGLFVEAASAAAAAVLNRLPEALHLSAESHVLIVATSTGLKDPHAISSLLPEVSINDV